MSSVLVKLKLRHLWLLIKAYSGLFAETEFHRQGALAAQRFLCPFFRGDPAHFINLGNLSSLLALLKAIKVIVHYCHELLYVRLGRFVMNFNARLAEIFQTHSFVLLQVLESRSQEVNSCLWHQFWSALLIKNKIVSLLNCILVLITAQKSSTSFLTSTGVESLSTILNTVLCICFIDFILPACIETGNESLLLLWLALGTVPMPHRLGLRFWDPQRQSVLFIIVIDWFVGFGFGLGLPLQPLEHAYFIDKIN